MIAKQPVRAADREQRETVDRNTVIAAAIRAVQRDGPRVTMSGIASEAGITKPIVYRTVGDKQAIAEAVAEHLSLRIAAMTGEIIEAGDVHAPTRFAAAARAYFELLLRERELFLFVEYGWGSDDGTQLEIMIERAASPFVERSPYMDDASTTSMERRRTWAYSVVGVLRTVATMWIRSPYCSVDELVDDVTNFVYRPRHDRGPGAVDSVDSPDVS